MKKIVRLTESELTALISRSVRRMINEDFRQGQRLGDDFYMEEDDEGKTGEPGQVKAYDVGYLSLSNAEADAEENGYDDVAEYLKYWWDEVSVDGIPFTWQDKGTGYGYKGDEIFTKDTENGGTLVCKDIYGQIMFDEYGPEEY